MGLYVGSVINNILNLLILFKLLGYGGYDPIIPGVFFLYSFLLYFLLTFSVNTHERQLADYNRDLLLKYGSFDDMTKLESDVKKDMEDDYKKVVKIFRFNLVFPLLINLLSIAQLLLYYPY